MNRNSKKTPQTNGAVRTTISARVDEELKQMFEREAQLRGHTVSQAVEFALRLGFARYAKKYPKVYAPIGKAA